MYAAISETIDIRSIPKNESLMDQRRKIKGNKITKVLGGKLGKFFYDLGVWKWLCNDDTKSRFNKTRDDKFDITESSTWNQTP